MLIAKNRYGEIVSAEDASRFQSYFCVACGAPVLLRKGTVQCPHFGHKARSASADCVYFHKGYDYYVPPQVLRSKRQVSAVCGSGLFLASPLNSTVEFYILFPNACSFTKWEGFFQVYGKWGEVSLTYDHLQSDRYVPLDLLSKNELGIKVVGDVDVEYLSLINSVSFLDKECNCFKFSEKYCRQLDVFEPVSLGEQYWVVASEDKCQPPDLININQTLEVDGWKIFLVEIPTILSSCSDKLLIEKWMGRDVKDKTEHLKVLAPLPLRIDNDGAYIVSVDTDVVIFYCENDEGLEVFDSSGRNLDFSDIGGALYSVRFFSSDIHISYNKSKIFSFKKSSLELFNPAGVSLQASSGNIALPSEQTVVYVDCKDDFQLLFSNDMVANVAKINGLPLVDFSLLHDFWGTGSNVVDIDNFGIIDISIGTQEHTLKLNDARLIKFLISIADMDSKDSIPFPFPVPHNAPQLLKRLKKLRWDACHLCYVMKIKKVLRTFE